jgi:hypothetical protein
MRRDNSLRAHMTNLCHSTAGVIKGAEKLRRYFTSQISNRVDNKNGRRYGKPSASMDLENIF